MGGTVSEVGPPRFLVPAKVCVEGEKLHAIKTIF